LGLGGVPMAEKNIEDYRGHGHKMMMYSSVAVDDGISK